MKTIVVVAKDGKKWEFSYDAYYWRFEGNVLMVLSEKGQRIELILNIELFAYLEVEGSEE